MCPAGNYIAKFMYDIFRDVNHVISQVIVDGLQLVNYL